MTVFDHLGVTVDNLARATEQFDAVMQALGFDRTDAEVAHDHREGEERAHLLP